MTRAPPLLLVLRAGDAAPPVAARRGEFFGWIREAGARAWPGAWAEHDARDLDRPLPEPSDASAFIITGSSSSVTERAPWMLRTEDLVRRIIEARVCLFGICFGHQLVAEALGGKVAKNPRGREIGTVGVRLLPRAPVDPLMADIPPSFTANSTHVDAVVSLPPGATLLAETDLDPHAIYAVGERTKCVQFHPEIDGDAMRGYIEARAHLIEAEGLDVEGIRARAVDAPFGRQTLENFVRYAAANR